MPKCLYPPCQEVAHSRGLCLACYAHATRLEKRGIVTWTWLINTGRALPKANIGGGYGPSGNVARKRWFTGKEEET